LQDGEWPDKSQKKDFFKLQEITLKIAKNSKTT